MPTLLPELERLAPLSDDELVQRIVAGDSAVFELLMRRHNQRLFRVARSVVRNDDEAEEIVQETYLRAYAHLGAFEGRSSVATWLTRIAFHEALRRRRRLRRRQSAETEGLDMDALPNRGGDADGPPDPVAQAELRSTLAAAMDALPTALRAIAMLRLVEGLSTRETAQSLRLSESGVKVGLHRARKQLCDAIRRQPLPALHEEFTFGSERCDRIVAAVFRRLSCADEAAFTR